MLSIEQLEQENSNAKHCAVCCCKLEAVCRGSSPLQMYLSSLQQVKLALYTR